MDHFCVKLQSVKSGYSPTNTIADFRTKLATPLELDHDRCEVGLVEISYPKGYKKRPIPNTRCLDSEEILFPVKHYELLFVVLQNISQIYEPSINENFVRIFSKYINKYENQSEELFNSCRGENSITITENLVSANCRFFTVNLCTKDNLTLLSLNLYTFISILSNQIWFEILMYDYILPSTSHRKQVTIDFTTHCTSQWNSPL